MDELQRLMNKGYNAGAARWIMSQIEAGNGTLDQYLFDALDLRFVSAKNAEHADFQPSSDTPAATTLTVRVRPNGSFANYLAYGHIKEDGSFVRTGYPKDVLKPRYGDSWGKRGGNQYEYEISFDVPATFPFSIVKVYNQSAVQSKSVEVLYTPKGAK
jgi:hypothetical protein